MRNITTVLVTEQMEKLGQSSLVPLLESYLTLAAPLEAIAGLLGAEVDSPGRWPAPATSFSDIP